MHRSFPVEENNDFKGIIPIIDHDEEKPITVPQTLLNDSNISDGEKCDKTDNINCIVDALRCALVSFERHIQAENNCTNDIKNLCNEAKSLQAKLRDKKGLIINHFQNVVSNLSEEK
ncbi:hypothetical protein Smp_144500 [Schistosoma mansoni]|uniref:Mediator of RNA polymerase II transcription subunit 9 n=1 Tax=Schistosoma mansoni TaxID=6183 RepID=G4V7K1_SCHMA|nr:hypothetical protein Smp_144500 [Schistosoma mansoni]|eukprot:XP_018648870.1 hypothetical protein Smp_144500 [Schistosoma mansoni]